jgi:hypothetical protein
MSAMWARTTAANATASADLPASASATVAAAKIRSSTARRSGSAREGGDLEREPKGEQRPDERLHGRESLLQRFSTSLATAGSPIEAAKLSVPAANTFAPAGVS